MCCDAILSGCLPAEIIKELLEPHLRPGFTWTDYLVCYLDYGKREQAYMRSASRSAFLAMCLALWQTNKLTSSFPIQLHNKEIWNAFFLFEQLTFSWESNSWRRILTKEVWTNALICQLGTISSNRGLEKLKVPPAWIDVTLLINVQMYTFHVNRLICGERRRPLIFARLLAGGCPWLPFVERTQVPVLPGLGWQFTNGLAAPEASWRRSIAQKLPTATCPTCPSQFATSFFFLSPLLDLRVWKKTKKKLIILKRI